MGAIEENVEMLNPTIIFGAAALLFNEDVYDFFEIEQNPEKERHFKMNSYFGEVIQLYCLSGKYLEIFRYIFSSIKRIIDIWSDIMFYMKFL